MQHILNILTRRQHRKVLPFCIIPEIRNIRNAANSDNTQVWKGGIKAVTSIWPIKGRVDQVIHYARNPEKTTEASGKKLHEIEGIVLELRERLKEYTGFAYSVIPESIVEAFIERIWVSKDEFRWYLRTGKKSDGAFDPDDHIKIGSFTLSIDDAKKYLYSFSTLRRVYKWADLNVSVWV